MSTRRRAEHTPHALARASRDPFRRAIYDSAISFDAPQTAAIDALSTPARHGYYLWGDVGRGKSLISELYFASIPTARKRRFHFHGFFQELQAQIVRERQPLADSLRRLIGNARAVFFDEFHVHDVADGVYLSATLQSLLEAGTLILTTSNYEPGDLMPNPLHHERFRPVIEIIRAELDIVHIGDGQDYRLLHGSARDGFSAGTWREQPQNPDSTPTATAHELSAAGHTVSALDIDGDTIVVTFDELCAKPLGVAQYLWLAERFRAIALTGVPDLATVQREPLARFANLIDVLYDRDVRLDVSAADGPGRLLKAVEPPRDAKRIASRLAALSAD